MDKKILVIGAAGFVGAPVAKQLLADGFAVNRKCLLNNWPLRVESEVT